MGERIKMFINFSNHPSTGWTESQKQAAEQWGEVIDIPFPSVPGEANETFIEELAEKAVRDILIYQPDVVMCQGEFTLAYAVIWRLKAQGIKTVAACSERRVEEIFKDGKYEKKATFEFIKFREYR